MIYKLIILLLSFQLILGLKNIKYSIIFLVIISQLIPFTLKFSLGSFSLNTFNLTTLVFFICSIKHLKNKNLEYKKIERKLFWVCIYIVMSSLLTQYCNSDMMMWLKNTVLIILEFFLVAFTFYHIKLNDKDIKHINITILIVGIIISIYSIFNYITKSNPYISFVSLLTGETDGADYFINEVRGVLSGRVSSTFTHPLILGQMMLLSFAYLSNNLKTIINNKIIVVFINILFIIPIFLCGSRSALVPLFLIPTIYLFFHGIKKYLKIILLFICFSPFIITIIPDKYQKTAEAIFVFWDDSKSDKLNVSGSSSDLRYEQHMNAFKIIDNNPLFGKGNGYIKEKGNKHPEMLGYEGLLLYTLVDWGILGTIIFLYLLYYYIIWSKRFAANTGQKVQFLSLIIPYIVAIFLTGISYSSFSYYNLLFFLLVNQVTNNKDSTYRNNKKITITTN